MITVVLISIGIQAAIGAIMLAWFTAQWHDSKNSDFDSKTEWMKEESRNAKIGLLLLMLSPLAILSIPAAIAFGVFYLIKRTIQAIIPVMKYEAN